MQLEEQSLLLQPFLLPAQEMLLYPAASEAIRDFEGSQPYKGQRES